MPAYSVQEMMFWELGSKSIAKPVRVIHACHLDWVTSVAWSDTANFVVTASVDQSVKVWDVTSYTEKFHLQGHEAAITSVAYSVSAPLPLLRLRKLF